MWDIAAIFVVTAIAAGVMAVWSIRTASDRLFSFGSVSFA